MSAPARALRRASIILVALGSAACAVFLIWRFVSVEQVGAVPTVHLLGVLGLFVLPVATLAAMEIDRRVAVRSPGVGSAAAGGGHDDRPGAGEPRSHAPADPGARRRAAWHRAARGRHGPVSRA